MTEASRTVHFQPDDQRLGLGSIGSYELNWGIAATLRRRRETTGRAWGGNSTLHVDDHIQAFILASNH